MKWWKDQWTIDPSGRKRTNARVGGFWWCKIKIHSVSCRVELLKFKIMNDVPIFAVSLEYNHMKG